MKQTFTFLAVAISFLAFGQTTASFESFNLPVDSFLNGSDQSGGFADGNVFLPNEYVADPMFPYWSGWALSATTDVTTPGFDNEFSAITGEGFNGSSTYATSFIFGESRIKLEGAAAGGTVEGMYVTNSTYAYLSLQDGDFIAKKFGGPTGDDPDYFLLTIRASLDGEIGADSVNFYLADYRDADNSNDYIVDEWTYVDLTSLGNADELVFSLSSTDIGQFGMNTPAYFCVDEITTTDNGVTSTSKVNPNLDIKIFPNPASEFAQIEWNYDAAPAQLFDINGKSIKSKILKRGMNHLSVNDVPKGVYFLQVNHESGLSTKKLIIE